MAPRIGGRQVTDKRTHCTVTMTPDLYKEVKQRCRQEDKPLTVWVRELIRRELQRIETGA